MRFLTAMMISAAAVFGYFQYGEGAGQSLSSVFDTSAAGPASESEVEALAMADDEVMAVPGPDVMHFGQIFRFDLTPDHVMQRWQRVSAGLSDMDLHGYRVPLVTGIEETDLAGSLTYYFDPKQRVRRIAFFGTTANPTRLVEFLQTQLRYRRVFNRDPRRENYVGRSGFRGYCSIIPAEVIDQETPQTRFGIELLIER